MTGPIARGPGLSKPTRIALVLSGLLLLCLIGGCVTAVVVGPQLADVAGCSNGPPHVSGVQTDPERIAQVLPDLGAVTAPHWRWREARPHTCPEIGPMDLVYEGFAGLAPDTAAALRSAYEWHPTAAPQIPADLASYAPPAPAWQRSAAFDSRTGGRVWLDPGSGTVYFSYLRG